MLQFHTLRLYTILTIAWRELGERLLQPPGRSRDERGSITIEYVVLAVASIVTVAIVVWAVREYVTSESGKIR